MSAAPSKPAKASRRRTKLLASGMEVQRVPPEVRRQATCVLEVLAGMRSPEEAAAALGVCVPTYYHLETRALRGLVHGCAAEPPGRRPALEKRLRESESRCREHERQLQRYQALLRSAQRAADLAAPPRREASKAGRRKGHKPAVRALRAVAALQDAEGGPEPPAEGPPQ